MSRQGSQISTATTVSSISVNDDCPSSDEDCPLELGTRNYGATVSFDTPHPAYGGGEISNDAVNRQYSQPELGPVRLTWENLDVYAEQPQSCRQNCGRAFSRISRSRDPERGYDVISKPILVGVSGCADPGTLLAIMGASGSGKTTLMNTLNRRNTRNLTISGEIRFNGEVLQSGVSSVSGYVQQDDLFIGLLTAKEHLTFHAMLRMNRHVSQEERRKRVSDVMSDLQLEKCANTRIGIPGRIVGLSGGEKKRLSVATEILTNPSLLFCDEPTSALDSFMAESLIKCLKNLAAQGKTIVCTIHQPSSQVFNLFHRVMFMANGRVAFMGTINEMHNIFSKVNKRCPENFNPADYYIHALAVMPGKEAECHDNIEAICKVYRETEAFNELMRTISSIDGERKALTESLEYKVAALKTKSQYKASYVTQFRWVLWRSWLSVIREPALMKTNIILAVITGLLGGLIFQGQEYIETDIMNINGIIFLMQEEMCFSAVMIVINTFPVEYPVFMREHHDATYRVSVYYVCKMFAETPILILTPLIYSVIAYFMIGLYSSLEAFLIFTATLVLVGSVSASFGYMLSCISSNVNAILVVAPSVVTLFITFGGYYLNTASVPIYFIWCRYLSLFNYSNEILVVNQWRHVGNITTSSSEKNEMTGQDVIDKLNYNERLDSIVIGFPQIMGNMALSDLWFDFVMLLVLVVAFRTISIIFLFVRTRKRQ